MTEADVQNALSYNLSRTGAWPILPNVDNITGYEADIIAITRAGYAHEYEIKLSISDFRADMKKVQKHASLSGKVKIISHPFWQSNPDKWPEKIAVLPDTPDDWTSWRLISNQCFPEKRPARFWYVIHGFDLTGTDVPSYAGLKIYMPSGKSAWSTFKTIKEAPKLDARPATQDDVIRATRNMLYRYWTLRRLKHEQGGQA